MHQHIPAALVAADNYTPTAPGGINADGLIGLFLWVILIIACVKAVRILWRSDTTDPRDTGKTTLNMGMAVAIIVVFLGGALIWTFAAGLRDAVLRGGNSADGPANKGMPVVRVDHRPATPEAAVAALTARA